MSAVAVAPIVSRLLVDGGVGVPVLLMTTAVPATAPWTTTTMTGRPTVVRMTCHHLCRRDRAVVSALVVR